MTLRLALGAALFGLIFWGCRVRIDEATSLAAADQTILSYKCTGNLLGNKDVNWTVTVADDKMTIQKSPKQSVSGYYALEKNWSNTTYHLHAYDTYTLKVHGEESATLDVRSEWKVPVELDTPLDYPQPPSNFARYLCK